jgi:hypothetical protein
MGVDDVERRAGGAVSQQRRAAITSAELEGRMRKRSATGRELIELDVQAVEAMQRSDLIADEAPALGVCGVGQHV